MTVIFFVVDTISRANLALSSTFISHGSIRSHRKLTIGILSRRAVAFCPFVICFLGNLQCVFFSGSSSGRKFRLDDGCNDWE